MVYFSSQMVETQCQPYYLHKLKIESLIKQRSPESLIIRLPQLIYYKHGAPSLIPSICDHIIYNSHRFSLKPGVKRSLVSLDDLSSFVKYLTSDRLDQVQGPFIFSPPFPISVETIYNVCRESISCLGRPGCGRVEELIESRVDSMDNFSLDSKNSIYKNWFSEKIGIPTERNIVQHQLLEIKKMVASTIVAPKNIRKGYE